MPNGVTVIAYSPFAQGELFSKRLRGAGVLNAIATEIGKTPARLP